MSVPYKLLSPIVLGPISLKNRIVLAALHSNLADDGDLGPRALAFFERRARGGAGLLMIGVANSEPPRMMSPAYDFSTDQALPSFRAAADAIHRHGASAGIQLTPLPFYGSPALRPEPEQLPLLLEHLASAADRARRAGFDLVELMASGGSLVSHLLSPVHNTWGIPGYCEGPEQRLRFALEAVAAMRRAVGPGLAVTVRIHGHEYLEDGYGLTDACQHARALVDAGAHAINVTGGGHTSKVPQITAEVPRGAYLYLARSVRRAVRVPVFASNRIGGPTLAEEVLRRSDADLVNLPRALVADPDLPLKTGRGELDLIRPCIACAVCLDCAMSGRPLSCTVNPEVGHEHQPGLPPLPTGTRAVVVGGGPAGCEAALRLQDRGASVTVIESGNSLGGKLQVAAAVPGREEIATLARYHQQALARQGITLRLGEHASADTVGRLRPNVLVLATGARPKLPAIAGIDRPNVVLAEQVLRLQVDVGNRAAVIGAGGVGLEVALFVAHSATIDPACQAFLVRTGAAGPVEAAALARSGKPVTVCCRGVRVCQGVGRATRWTLTRHLEELGGRIVRGASYQGIEPEGLRLRHPDGREELIGADTIIVAAGFKPDPDLAARFSDCAARILVIGDARSVGNIGAAVRDAWEQVRAL